MTNYKSYFINHKQLDKDEASILEEQRIAERDRRKKQRIAEEEREAAERDRQEKLLRLAKVNNLSSSC